MSTFISGGSKSGKSMLAQRIARECAAGGAAAPVQKLPLYYVATMLPADAEDEARIKRHVEARAGWGFVTLERGRDILGCLNAADTRGAFLIDSVTALLSNEMFAPEGINAKAHLKIADDLSEFLRRAPHTVLVSDCIYADAAVYDDLTEAFRAGLAFIDRRMAALSDNVIEAAYGQFIIHKGVLPL